ncbi:hypothetical protein AMQ84_12735 [Paenibacillus riograndensis]|uniref:Uncharacterized protein n=1 Tax=Paenibacillus riograndensis TaxID=483937 RepID=A0A132U168_9BACL|nr:hypothetical protein AMQ84_12735 [Paenibacillus riograndensis]
MWEIGSYKGSNNSKACVLLVIQGAQAFFTVQELKNTKIADDLKVAGDTGGALGFICSMKRTRSLRVVQ